MPGIIRTPMVDDDGSGTTGTILNNAWKQELYGQIDGLVAAPWINVPFVASDYGAVGGTWTISAASAAYAVLGKTLFFELFISNSVFTGAPTQLTRKPFGGIPINRAVPGGVFLAAMDASTIFGLWNGANGAPGQLNFFRDFQGSAFTAGATILLRMQGFYEVG